VKVDLTDLSPVKKQLAIEVSPDELDRELRTVLQAYARRARIPGFRPGKTPLELIRQRFRKEVEEDVRERLVARSFERAARERGLRPVGEASLDELTHEDGRPFAFKATFEVLPEIQPAGYRGLEVRRQSPRVTDAEVDQALEELRAARVRHVHEPGRHAQVGDIVVADLEGTPAEGEPFRQERAQIEVGAATNLPDLDRVLPGLAEGAEVELTVDYPPGYPVAALAGKRADLRLHVHEVKRRDLPALDDELARELGEEFQGLEDLRRRLREDLGARKSHQATLAVRQALLDKVLLANTVLLPEVLVEREIRQRLEEIARNLLLGGVDLEKAEIDWNALRQRQLEPARRAVHARLVLDAIAQAEQITVEPAEMDHRIQAEARRHGETPQRLRATLQKHGGEQTLRAQLLREKTLDYLSSVANIQGEE
jgi:trigger factor